MAITFARLTQGGNAGTQNYLTTASVSPGSNRLLLLKISTRRRDSVNPSAPTSVTGCGLTWVQVATIVWDTTSSSRKRDTLYRALGTPTAGTITAEFDANNTHATWTLDEVDGVDTGGTNGSGAVVQANTAKDESTTATSLSVSLSAFGSASNAAYGAFTLDNDGALPFTVGSGFTSLGTESSGSTGFLCAVSEYKLSSDTTVDVSWASSGNSVGGIALEIKEAGSSGQNLSPSLLTNGQTFYAATVSRGTVSLAPSLVTNSQTFFAPTVALTHSLTPSLVTNAQVFYGPVVAAGAVTLQLGLVINTQTFFAPTVTSGEITLTPPLAVNGQIFYAPMVSTGAGPQELQPSLVTNAQTFYGVVATASYTLSPEIFTNEQIFPAASVSAQNMLAPTLVTNTSIFYSATVSAGAVNLQPSLSTNEQIFYAPTVLQQSNIELLPGLLTNEQSFFSPTVAFAPQAQTQFGGWFTSTSVPARTRKDRDEERQRLGILPTTEIPVTPVEVRELTRGDRQRAHRMAKKLLECFAPEPSAPVAAVALPPPGEQSMIGPGKLPMEVQATLVAAQKKRAFEQDLVYIVATLIS